MSSYYERQKDLFNTLKEAEEQCGYSAKNQTSKDGDYGVVDRQTYRRLKHDMKQFRGRESIFKRPEAKIRDCLRTKSTPDHLKNPQKYVYYSLADVTDDQMSDSTNASTALALMQKLEENKAENKEIEQDPDEGVFKKPTFRPSATVKRELKNEEQKIEFRSNKVVMPEYVVGVSSKPKKEKVRKERGESTAGTKPALTLQHLIDEEED